MRDGERNIYKKKSQAPTIEWHSNYIWTRIQILRYIFECKGKFMWSWVCRNIENHVLKCSILVRLYRLYMCHCKDFGQILFYLSTWIWSWLLFHTFNCSELIQVFITCLLLCPSSCFLMGIYNLGNFTQPHVSSLYYWRQGMNYIR